MRARLAHIPQRHFVGEDDTQVPAIIAQSYLSSLPQKTCVVLDVLAGATHEDGWVDNWPALLQRDVACRP